MFSGMALAKMTEREEMVGRRQQIGDTTNAKKYGFSHHALETGPLKSEAQGLDLSVDIAWMSCAGFFCYCPLLLRGHHTVLLCNVVFATTWDAAATYCRNRGCAMSLVWKWECVMRGNCCGWFIWPFFGMANFFFYKCTVSRRACAALMTNADSGNIFAVLYTSYLCLHLQRVYPVCVLHDAEASACAFSRYTKIADARYQDLDTPHATIQLSDTPAFPFWISRFRGKSSIFRKWSFPNQSLDPAEQVKGSSTCYHSCLKA